MLTPNLAGDKQDHAQSVLLSTAVGNPTSASRPKITMIQPASQSPQSKSIVSVLSTVMADDLVNPSGNVADISTAGLDGKVCICLAEMDSPILSTCTEAQWLSIREMLSSASTVLWVTSGGTMDVNSAEAGLIPGLARSSRSDNQALRLVTLDLDPNQNSPEQTARLIADVLDKTFVNRTGGELTKDVEYVERGGRILIPRLVEDTNLQQYLTSSTTIPEPETQPFFQADRTLRLEVGTRDLLDSLRFVEDTTASLPLGADELRMKPVAYGINFRDVMISLGQLEDTSLMSSEHSGVVTEVGTDLAEQFRVGDRICAWGGNAYASSVRVNDLTAQHIPDDMTFETAASIPIVYATVYYALVHLARLQNAESVLIHSAAGGVGQAAIMLAKYLGATIFVTVGSNEKKALVMDAYGISENHIFSSRQTTFVEGIKRLTSGRGVDVILNSIAGEGFLETCRCIARLGRFIEIGKRDILANSRLDMEMFNRSVTFASVDLTIVFQDDPELGRRMVGEVFELLREGVVSPVRPLNVFSLSEIEGAFRSIQAGKNVGKVVLKVDDDTAVKVCYPFLILSPLSEASFRSEALESFR